MSTSHSTGTLSSCQGDEARVGQDVKSAVCPTCLRIVHAWRSRDLTFPFAAQCSRGHWVRLP